MSKKPTKKQLAARAKFKYIMQHGGFKKSKNKSKKLSNKKISHAEALRLVRAKRKGVRADRSNIDDSLLLALNDPNVKEIIIRK